MKAGLLFITLFLTQLLSAQERYFSDEDLDERGKTNLEGKFNLSEIPLYTGITDSNTVFLENGYASAVIKNPAGWPVKGRKYEVTEVNLIYTKYPVDKNLWRTNYRKLLTARLKELFKLDNTLNSDEIEWNIILQTICKNEKETMALPHGIEIVFEPLTEREIKTENTAPGIIQSAQAADSALQVQKSEKQIGKFLKVVKAAADSTGVVVFERHPEWKKSLVVMDWSGSMQGFGGKVILWHVRNLQKSGIKNVVIFTDKTSIKKQNKSTDGGVYFIDGADPRKLVKMMRKARNTDMHLNPEIEENNIEALIKGVEKYSDFNELIMIADNRSCMKDYCLSGQLKVPVRIILCGTKYGINPQYVNLAYQTGGSIHTMESDLDNLPSSPVEGDELKIENSVFKFNQKKNRYEAVGKIPKYAYQNCGKFYRKKCP